MSWFKKDAVAEQASDVESSVEAVLPLVRTMEDDLSGRTVPARIPEKKEPLVSFNPNAPEGAPFYAAPGVETSEAMPSPSETEMSPFLQTPVPTDVPTSSPREVATSAPVAAPPTGLPVIPDDHAASNQQPESEAKPVALNIATPGAGGGASFEGMLPSSQLPHRLKALFTGEKARWILLGSVLVIILLSIGGWYIWQKIADKPSIPGELANSPLAPAPEQSTPIEPSVPKYQSDQPNILSFDTETVTPEEIKSALLQAGQGIRKDKLSGAVEFLVRDQKLNPLALSRFAYLAKLELPAGILEALDEPFSIYIAIDGDRPRAVLLAYIKNQEAFSLELEKNENLLPPALDPLYLDMTTAPKRNLSFRDGMYLERPVRFTNVDAALGLSVDYAVRGKQWIVGTSKNSLRAVLDKTGL